MKIIGFHNPSEEYGFLSNWYLSNFSLDGVDFTSMEQFMMYKKALCFQDRLTARQIMKTEDVARIKQLGRSVAAYDDQLWSGIRQLVVYEGLLGKFSQDERLRNALLDTGDAILAECAVRDRIWGIGLAMTDADRLRPERWRGQNLLGYALMMTRWKVQSK